MGSRLVLIPARGGSTRVPRKNVRDFLGRPAISRVIDTVLASGVVDEVVVSTDDAEIAETARAAGASVPFVRPSELADAYTGARPVIQHAIAQLGLDAQVRLGVCYATAVMLRPRDVVEAERLLDPATVDFVMTVAEFPAPIERALRVRPDGLVEVDDASYLSARSQDLVPAYHDLGQMYWGTVRAWSTDTPVATARTRAFVMESWRAVDIDTPEDWVRAERLFRADADG